MAEKKCAHQGCNCSGSHVRPDGYCSDACKQGKEQGGRCACGDSACKG
jgi:hypothetical protein